MKRAEVLFNLFSIPIDAAMVIASAVFAFVLRYKFGEYVPIQFQISFTDYFQAIAIAIPFLLILFAVYGLYNVKSTDKLNSELTRIISAVTTALMVMILIFFFNSEVFPSRLIVLTSWVTTIALVSAGRILIRFARDGSLRRGYGAHRMIAVVGDTTDMHLINYIQEHPEMGYKIVETINTSSPDLMTKLEEAHNEHNLDEFMQADPDLSSQLRADLVVFCHDRGIRYNFVPDIFNLARRHIEIEMLSGVPVVKLKGTPLDGWGRVLKRTVDVITSFIAMIILSPVLLLTYLAVKLTSPGPALYVAPRGGRDGEFQCYKFRTMYTHLTEGEDYGGQAAQEYLTKLVAEKSVRGGPLWKIKDDPRITTVGSTLRKYKLDELPQLWNVFRGDMSIVGPRPHQMNQVVHYLSTHRRLFTVRPGLSGLTQIAQIQKPDLPWEEETRLDTFYIENWSLWLDVKIILRTAWLLVTHKHPKENYG